MSDKMDMRKFKEHMQKTHGNQSVNDSTMRDLAAWRRESGNSGNRDSVSNLEKDMGEMKLAIASGKKNRK